MCNALYLMGSARCGILSFSNRMKLLLGHATNNNWIV